MFTRTIILNLLNNTIMSLNFTRYVLRLTMDFYSSHNDSKSNFISSENQPLISSINSSIKTTTPPRVVRISRCPFTCTFCSRTVHYSPLLSVLSLNGLPSATINIAPSYFPAKINCRRKIKRKEIHNYLIPCPS